MGHFTSHSISMKFFVCSVLSFGVLAAARNPQPAGTRISGCANVNWMGDSFCDDENNNAGCSFDGGDCCNNDNQYWDYYCTACEGLDPAYAGGSSGTGGTSDDCTCGIKNPGASRISGGGPTAPNEWPWQVMILRRDDDYFSCAGTLINDQFIITAGHCVLYSQASQLKVRLGNHNKDSKDAGAVDINVEWVAKAPNFWLNPLADDIAIFKLETPVTFNDNIRPICLPENTSDDFAGDNAITAGWGILGWGWGNACVHANPGPLYHTDIKVLNNGMCGKWDPSQVKMESMVCAGGDADEHGACSGDGGGPLMVEDNGAWTLVGVNTLLDGYKCGEPDYPSIYTRVTPLLDWINSMISSGTSCARP